MKRILAAFVALSAAALIAAGAGSASAPQPQPLSCGGLGDLQILTPPANGADQNWGSARVVGDGHLTPVAFRFSAFDNTVGAPLFDSGLVTKAGGNANHNQSTTICTQEQTGTLADFLEPGDEVPPPPFALTDSVTFTVWASAVAK